MYLTHVSAMEWALDHMNESQTAWIGQRDWCIEFLKPLVYNLLSDSPYNYQFSVAVELESDRDLSFAQLLFSDSYLEIAE